MINPNFSPVPKSSVRKKDFVPGELIVKLANSGQTLDTFESTTGAQVVEQFELPKDQLDIQDGPMLRLKLAQDDSVESALKRLRQDKRVEFAEPNFIYTLEGAPEPPNDLHEKLWGLQNTGQTGGKVGADVNALGAWETTTGNKGPLISVIDSGIDYEHDDLKANMWTNPGEIPGDGIDNDENGVIDDIHGYNAYADNGDPWDGHSHGTHCAGTIAAAGNNGEGVTGVMQSANLMAVKIFSNEGRTSTDAIVRGILYSAKMGADITSNSWGGKRRSDAIYEAFKAHPGLHVVAAGNSAYDNDQKDNFPSNYDLDNIVAVAATNHIDQRASFSQWGAKNVDVAAPGRNIYSTVPLNKYGIKSGTSMATPHVTGGAGLILSEYPEASNQEIKQRLIYGSDRLPSMLGISVSNGRVNFANSLEDDRTPPGTPNDFETHDLTTRGGILSWTSVGDDKWANGAAPVVEVWKSETPLHAQNLDQAEKVMLEGAEEVGDLATLPFKALPKESPTPVHFAMRSLDNVGNSSVVSFTSAMIPAADIAFQENFDGQKVEFGATGDFKQVEVEGRGQVFSSQPGPNGSVAKSKLTSTEIDLTDRQNSFLRFDYHSDFGFAERATVWASLDGETWTREAFLKKDSEGWLEQAVNISEYDGKKLRLRFEVQARTGNDSGGLMLDNVRVLVEPQGSSS